MKLLSKILLINWHMFTCSEIEVRNNVLITGHNGAGKSTLLDAMQYVLTGGKTKFNLAANEDGNRKLEGYVRGRLGTETQENIRNEDVTTHIALQFYDEEEKQDFIIGSVIDLPEGGKCRENFYIAYRCKADKNLFIKENGEILNKGQFERNLNHLKIKNNFMNTKEEARRMVTSTFSLSSKYTELIRRALAFKPIGDLNEFMYRFLLPEEKINIDSLRENVLLYRQFENTLNEQKERLKILEEINELNEELKKLELKLKISDFLGDMIYIEEYKNKLEELEILIRNNERDLKENKDNEIHLQQKLDDIDDQLTNIKSQMHNLDPENRISILEERVKKLKTDYKNCETWFNDCKSAIGKDVSIINKLSIAHQIRTDERNIIEDESLSDKLFELERKISETKENNLKRQYETVREKEETEKQTEEIRETLNLLEQKRYPYDEPVRMLVKLLEEELSKSAGRPIEVKPFCEYLEVNDEKWRNAIEGYLNTQRFDLFVEPRYFRNASRIYEQFKEDRGIYGVGIVDTGKLEQFEEIKTGTLAEKVNADNIYARQYANMLLGKVECEDSVELLNTHKQAITPSCMVYRNYTVRAINPRIYYKPFIGLKAIDIQLKDLKEKYQVHKTSLQNINRRINDINHQKELLGKLDLSYISSFASSRQRYLDIKDELEDNTKQYEQLRKDPSWITLEEQKRQLDLKRNETSELISQKQNDSARIVEEIKTRRNAYDETNNNLRVTLAAQEEKKEEMLEYLGRIEKEYSELKRKARGEFGRMSYQNDKNKNEIEESKRADERVIRDVMHNFNNRTSFGYEETLEAIPQYMEQYDKLRLIDIEDSINRTIEARKKCEKSFEEDFISTLRNRIERAKANLRQLNKALEDKDFQGDSYSFVFEASSDPVFSRYYKILCSNQDYARDTIFMEELSEQNRQLMDELFAKLVSVDNNEKNEQILRDYTDYRKYMKYDIRITHSNGDTTMFSKVNKEKSGGETQTPFYVIIAASFDQLAISRKGNSAGCLVLFDEAFNNMDENRIGALMRFYGSLNIQLMIAVPEGRVRNIMPYVDTTILLVKQNNRVLNREIINEG